MRLEKWYGDWMEDGRPQVRYRAALSLGRLAISFDGSVADRRASGAFSRGRDTLPALARGRLEWPASGGDMTWHGAAHRRFVLGSQGDCVVWEPVVGSGRVTRGGLHLGLGYAERLTLRKAPWALGLSLLRWGRFCAEGRSLSWIEWVGTDPVRLVLLDGNPVAMSRAGLDGIAFDGGILMLPPCRPFVETPLGQGLLGDMPWPRRIRPLAFLDGMERKYACAATLVPEGEAPVYGEALFEEVSW